MRRLDCCMLKVFDQQLMHVWGGEEVSCVKILKTSKSDRRRCEQSLCGLLGISNVNLKL